MEFYGPDERVKSSFGFTGNSCKKDQVIVEFGLVLTFKENGLKLSLSCFHAEAVCVLLCKRVVCERRAIRLPLLSFECHKVPAG